MRRSAMALAKRITIPQLSPTHTSARVVRFLCEPGTSVEEYRPVLILQCTADLVADPADRPTPGYKPFMLLESLEEGVLKELDDWQGEWIDVGTVLGVVDDGDEIDGDWTWQAYLHDEDDEE